MYIWTCIRMYACLNTSTRMKASISEILNINGWNIEIRPEKDLRKCGGKRIELPKNEMSKLIYKK